MKRWLRYRHTPGTNGSDVQELPLAERMASSENARGIDAKRNQQEPPKMRASDHKVAELVYDCRPCAHRVVSVSWYHQELGYLYGATENKSGHKCSVLLGTSLR